jgi:hypothetical protein
MRMSIYLTPEYPQIWNCRGFRPFFLPGDGYGTLRLSGRSILAFGVPVKTIIGGMAGDGILRYDDETIREAISNSRGVLQVYSFEKKPVLLDYGFSERRMYTFIVDIGSTSELWHRIRKTNRTAIRFAEKSGVRFTELRSWDEVKKSVGLFEDQRRRWRYQGPGMDYFENVWRILAQSGRAAFFAAVQGERTLSVAEILFHQKDMVMPQWGTSNEAKSLKANNFLIWKILEHGNFNGFKRFNFWGAEEGPNTAGSHYGIYKFKESFGGRLRPVYKYERSGLAHRFLLGLGNLAPYAITSRILD